MNRKSKLLVAMVLVAFMVTFAYAKNEPNPVTYTDHQRFRGDVTINAPNSVNPADVIIGPNATIQYESGYAVYMTTLTFVNTNLGDYTNGTGWTLTSPRVNGTVVRVDMTGVTDYVASRTGVLGVGLAGVTLNLPTVTEAMDGWELTIVKIDTGVSEIVPYSSAGPVGSGSGTTPGASLSTLLMNAQGDAITLIADYNSAVSWWIKSSLIH